jgi:hypothetical protein
MPLLAQTSMYISCPPSYFILKKNPSRRLQNRRAIYLRDFADVIVGSLFASTAEGKTFDAYNTMDLVPEGGDNREWLKAVSKLPTDSELTKLGKPWPVDLQIPDDVRV